MKNILKRGLSGILALILVIGLMPVTALAAVDSSGRPKDVNNKLILSIYTGTGFPGEPAVYDGSDYKNINSRFTVQSGATFASSANNQLNWTEIEKDIVQGTSSYNTSVWGVYNTTGLEKYFLENATILNSANEAKIIRAVNTSLRNASDEDVLSNYEIIWYVIKLQHSRRATEWHIDGVIKEKRYASVNYYGNGNTSGDAPLGTTTHPVGTDYTVLGLDASSNPMKRVIKGVEVAFLGWSAKADGTGEEAGFYQPGDVITAEVLEAHNNKISLYAMWDTTTQYTATVNTYLDGTATDLLDIYPDAGTLHLSSDRENYYPLSRDTEGVYTTKITGNGKFHLYTQNAEGEYEQIGTHQLTIYNQNGSLDVHYYSVNYDPAGGAFETEPGKLAYAYAEPVTAITTLPVREGYRFLGWQDADGKWIQPGQEVTAAIAAPITLTAQWEETVKVTVNVTINHVGGDGFDQAPEKDNVVLTVASKVNKDAPYLEVGETLKLNSAEHTGFQYSTVGNVTKYEGYTLTDMPGGETEYTVVTSKSGYETSVTNRMDENGDWIVDVEMTYKPSNFDVNFTIDVDDSVPDAYLPDAVIAKVTFWATGKGVWEIITQQAGGEPGVRVDIDPDTRSGSGSYPVWKYESNSEIPYGYRIEITSFVYPDGTIVPVSQVLQKDAQWTDEVYIATMSEVTGGQQYGTLNGAYYDQATDTQKGTLNAVITMDLYDVTFDAQGGEVNGNASQTVTEQYKIPSFKDYVPTREGGYTFGGWYVNKACTVAAVEGKDLTEDTTLYAMWIEPLTISGTVTILGAYELNGQTVPVNDIDKAKEAIVILQEKRNGSFFEVDSQLVEFTYGNDENGVATYSFSERPNEGKEYRIQLLLLNYSTEYDNESDADRTYSAGEYDAIFGRDNVAEVDALLEFVPPSYWQDIVVNAEQIGVQYRPQNVLAKVMYRDTGDKHPFQVISQHRDSELLGVNVALVSGKGTGSESIWKWHTDGTLYEYQMNITLVDGAAYDSDTAPYYIQYAEPAYWDADADEPSGALQAMLIPKQYPVVFALNAGDDQVTGMEAYKSQITETDEEGVSTTTDVYQTTHTWSFNTAITAVPQREGYTFKGWQANVENAYINGEISAAVHQEVVLTAQWERERYTVTTDTTPGGTATGGGEYDSGTTATVTANAEEGYLFKGWYEDGKLVSEEASYSFTVTSNRTLKAHFAKYYTITTIVEEGGTATGEGQYEANATVTITATAYGGYYFVGWYDEKGELITADTSYTLNVLVDRTFTAKFEEKVAYQCDYVYIFGYNDTEIGADGTLLRGELAQMIYRLVKQNSGAGHGNITFTDTEGEWFKTGISYMAMKGAIDRNQQYARPYAEVIRGEAYKMICLGLGFTSDTGLGYSDYAKILQNSGYLSNDGRVTAKISRGEFCELFNAILGRSGYCADGYIDTEGNEVTAQTYGYTDLEPGDRYYRTMMIATSTFTNGKIDLNKRAQRNPLDEYAG